ncbi:MAG: hypothetical protein PVJ27_00580 [Candidatus Brocadiaceae bacterium]|jgi:hypothetical protein
MTELPEKPRPEWNLGDWESVLTIHVGSAYACRQCENLVMVTRGGVGMLQLSCCGEPMEKVAAPRHGEDG